MTTLALGPRARERNTACSTPPNCAARIGAAPGTTIHARYGFPTSARSSPRRRIAARPPLPTARTSPGEPVNATRSVLGFARSASARRSTGGAAGATCGCETPTPSADAFSGDEPADRTAAAPSAIAAIPASTPSAASASGEGRLLFGMSTAHMLAAEPARSSPSIAGSRMTGMSGTVVTEQTAR